MNLKLAPDGENGRVATVDDGLEPEQSSAARILPELLKRAKAGDLAAFDRIMIEFQKQVYRIALRLLGSHADAEDAVQDVFFRLHRHLRKFDETRQFSPWLYRLTVNVCLDMRRKAQFEPVEGEVASGSPGPLESAESAETARLLREQLMKLPEKERAAVVLRDLEGLSTAEVARILGSSEATVRSQISSARLKLKRWAEGIWKGQ